MSAFKKPNEEMEYILATDVGSTTTKARFFRKRNGEWRYIVSGEAPTTVEEPFEDVTAGVKNAVREVEELTGHVILSRDGSGIIVPCEGDVGVDLYCTTSSAGGGLQMMVSGVIKSMTAASANRAALGAGAIVMDVMAVDDGREEYQKIRRIRSLRPDMILLAGGTDGGQKGHVLGMAEMMKASEPKPRLGAGYKLPLVYAGNKVVRPEIKDMMGDAFALSIVDNIRPKLEIENTEPARNAVHELFMEHVMSHAPGYNKLMTWTDVDIMPTPAGEGIGMQLIAKLFKKNVLGVGLGGATTNVYSIVGVGRKFVRSVSANLGMSYSICNVMKESGLENIMRWLPFDAKNETIRGRLVNKMIRPTTIPQTLEELVVEHSVAREALRLGLKHHTTIATRLKGVLLKRDIADMFDQKVKESYIDMMNIAVVAGTGGLLSHAPRRVQSMLILTDAWQLEGVTEVFQDSVFMMPHLGVLSTVYEEAAMNIFAKDCLINLGTVIAPIGLANEGVDVMTVNLEMPDGTTREEHMKFGEIRRIPLEEGKEINFSIYPRRGFDVGSGSGKELEGTIKGGIVGIMLDTRGRPLNLPEDPENRMNIITSWLDSLDVYPEGKIEKMREKIGRS